MKYIYIILLSLAVNTPALADVGDLRIVTLNKSWHYDDPSGPIDYNDKHEGIGIEVGIDKYTWLGYLKFKNSFYEDSQMLKMNYERPVSKKWYLGGMFGVADGYDWEPEKEEHMPFIAATIQYKIIERLGIRLTITPVVTGIGLIVYIN